MRNGPERRTRSRTIPSRLRQVVQNSMLTDSAEVGPKRRRRTHSIRPFLPLQADRKTPRRSRRTNPTNGRRAGKLELLSTAHSGSPNGEFRTVSGAENCRGVDGRPSGTPTDNGRRVERGDGREDRHGEANHRTPLPFFVSKTAFWAHAAVHCKRGFRGSVGGERTRDAARQPNERTITFIRRSTATKDGEY